MRAAIGITIGIVLPIAGGILSATYDPLIGKLIVLLGTGLMLWGCYYLVKNKGYHWALCLLGLLGCFGLLILLIIPNKNKQGGSWNPALVAAVIAGVGFIFVCFMGIVLAIAIPYYVSYKRTACDRSAAGDVAKLGAAMERLGNELRDSSLSWNEESAGELVSKNGIRYLVGPYYGWGGCSKKCGVLMRVTKEHDRWVAECVALKGSHPQGAGSRYVYRQEVIGGKPLPVKVTQNPIDAGDGQAQSWNSYPLADTCYIDSLVQKDVGSFTVKKPQSARCEALRVGK